MKRQLRRLLRLLPDKAFIRFNYWRFYGHLPHLGNPKTFDEKLQWYKLYYRDPLITKSADKYAVRQYIADKGLGILLNELYGVYNAPEEIDFPRLPGRFVLKATHGSGMNIICRDKRNLDWLECCQVMRKWLRTSHYHMAREWAYKGIKPRLICEKYLENEEYEELLDYKFYCFDGKPELLFVCSRRFSTRGLRYNAYDLNWNRLDIFKGRPVSDFAIQKPSVFEAMKDVVAELCKGFPFVRVDLYAVKQTVIFGEFTFYPDGGTGPFSPDSYNYYLGDLFVLPPKKIHQQS